MHSFGILGQKSKVSFPLNWSVDRAGFFWSFQGTLFTRLFELPEATWIPWFITLSSHYSICRVCGHIYSHQISLCLTLIGTLVIIFKVQLISLSQDIYSHQPWTLLSKYLFEYMFSVLWGLYPEVESLGLMSVLC